MDPGKWASIDLLAADLDREPDWDLADLTGSPNLGSQDSILGNCGVLVRCCWWSVTKSFFRMCTC